MEEALKQLKDMQKQQIKAHHQAALLFRYHHLTPGPIRCSGKPYSLPAAAAAAA
jgi:hypothetical protein